jgi:hypothetical protein
MTSTTTHQPHVADAVGPEPTQTPETTEFGPVAQPGALAALCAAGNVRLFRQRGTGTLRALPYLTPGTPARETAEYLAELLEDGASVAQAAADTGLSKATMRRAVENLALAYDIEAGDYDDLVEDGLDAVILAGDADEEDES